jgi:lipoprotein-releasing system permease protein
MLYQFKIGWRYLTSNLIQTGLLVLGVAVGVFVFVFMSALIGGLAVYLIDQTVGDISHVTVSEPPLVPDQLYPASAGALYASENATGREATVRNTDEIIATLAQLPGLVAVSPQLVGNGFVTRGAVVNPVTVVGVEPDKVSAIANVAGNLVAGRADLPTGAALIGQTLADDLGVGAGHGLRLRSDQGVDMTLTIVGVFEFGVAPLDERTVYVNDKTARGLFDLRHGVTRIELRIDDLWAAPGYWPRPGPKAMGS